jgi:DNA-binding NarL/FixJ family response regulator
LLTARQTDVLRLIAAGERHRQVASALFISESTVSREVHSIFDRLGVNDAAHAVAEAYKMGLL